ncbi:hypothetical protein Tco_1436920 [Tanacetum coccineum]
MDFRSFMVQGVDGEFNFLPEGGLDENQSSTKSVNNEAPVINAEPISVVNPSDIAKNIVDSRNTSSEEGGLSPIGLDAPSYLEVGKRSKVAGKGRLLLVPMERILIGRLGKFLLKQVRLLVTLLLPLMLIVTSIYMFPFAKELKDATDCHWVVAYVTPPYWKQYLREISIEQLCDIHDKAYMRQAVLDNVLNGRTRELNFALYKARASCDTIREREIKKDKAYAELEKKCNEAIQDLDKNLIVSDMRAKIETLQSRVNGLHIEGLESEGKRLRASEIQLLQEVDSLRQDRAAVVSRVIPDATMKLIHSDEMGVLIARLVTASIIHGWCEAFEEVAELKKPFVLEEMPSYRPSSKEEYDRAGNDLADASYPFLAELTADPHAFMEQLLSKKPQSL